MFDADFRFGGLQGLRGLRGLRGLGCRVWGFNVEGFGDLVDEGFGG